MKRSVLKARTCPNYQLKVARCRVQRLCRFRAVRLALPARRFLVQREAMPRVITHFQVCTGAQWRSRKILDPFQPQLCQQNYLSGVHREVFRHMKDCF